MFTIIASVVCVQAMEPRSAAAQQTPAANPPNVASSPLKPATNCGDARTNLWMGSLDAVEEAKIAADVVAFCQGEVVSVPGNDVLDIGKICDFSKSIYRSPSEAAVCSVRPSKTSWW